MGGSNTLLPSDPRMMAIKKVVIEGNKLAESMPIKNNPMPISIPVLRPRRSAIGAKNGPKALVPIDTAMANDIVPISTRNPLANIARNG